MKRLREFTSASLNVVTLLVLITVKSLLHGTATAEDGLPVFICAGGSNMGGHWSKIEELPRELREEQTGALFFDGKQWTPLSPDKVEGEGFGPEISFAYSMSRKRNRQIGIIKHSGSGTSLGKAWSPGNPDSLYWELIHKVDAARKLRPIKVLGLLMVQGSGDSKDQKTAEAYADNLRTFIQSARKDTQSPDMLFVCTRLRAGQPTGKYPFADLVRKAQETCSEYIDCDTLQVGSDNVHYTPQGQVELGRRFADKLHRMMGEDEKRR